MAEDIVSTNDTTSTKTSLVQTSTVTSTDDPITWKRFISGIGDPKNFMKYLTMGINLGLIFILICGGLFLWAKFFPKKSTTPQQTQNSSVTIESGANVSHLTVGSQSQAAQKRTVGLQISSTSKDAGIGLVKYLNESWAVVVGARWAYEKPSDGDSQVLPEVKVQYDFF